MRNIWLLSTFIPLKREKNIQTFFELKKWYDGLAQMKYKKPFVKPFEFNYKMEESIYLHFKYLQALKIATIPLHLQYICLLENNLHLSSVY